MVDYSKWDSLDEPSDDEDTGACIYVPGADGGEGTVYRQDELRTELPWQQQQREYESSNAAAPSKADEPAPSALPSAVEPAALAAAAPTAADPAPTAIAPPSHTATAAAAEQPAAAAEVAPTAAAQSATGELAAVAAVAEAAQDVVPEAEAPSAASTTQLKIREDRLLKAVTALNDLATQYRADGDRIKRLPLPDYIFLESRHPDSKQPRYACQCSWNELQVLGEPLAKKADAKLASALAMIYAMQDAGIVEILPFDPDKVSNGWVTISQSRYGATPKDIADQFRGNLTGVSPYSQLGYIWHMPADSQALAGLGGGIAWAWDDRLCDMLLPPMDGRIGGTPQLFKEDFVFVDFVSCHDLRAAMHRAFSSWSDNHRFISFIDVTEECRRMYGRVTSSCPLVEVWVTFLGAESNGSAPDAHESLPPSSPPPLASGTTRRLSEEELSSEAASTASATSSPAATAVPYVRYNEEGLRSTDGFTRQYYYGADGTRHYRPVIETYGGVISFNVDGGSGMCWYLDSTFCSGLHAMKAASGEALVFSLFSASVYGVFSIAVVVLTVKLFFVFKHQHCLHGADEFSRSLRMKCRASIEELASWGVLQSVLLLVCLWAPLACYTQILEPCWSCFDFEAAATHEIGHILGLSHPDNVPVSNANGFPVGSNAHSTLLASNDGMNPFPNGACGELLPLVNGTDALNLWDHVVNGVWADANDVDGGNGARQSIMEAFTQHNPSVCLSPDDIEGINMLYPDCRGYAITRPECFKSKHRLGWIRMAVYIGLPVVFLMLMLFGVSHAVREHHQSRLKSAKNLLATKEVKISVARADARYHEDRARQAQKELRRYRDEEDARVATKAHQMGVVYAKHALEEALRAGEIAEWQAADAAYHVQTGHAPPHAKTPSRHTPKTPSRSKWHKAHGAHGDAHGHGHDRRGSMKNLAWAVGAAKHKHGAGSDSTSPPSSPHRDTGNRGSIKSLVSLVGALSSKRSSSEHPSDSGGVAAVAVAPATNSLWHRRRTERADTRGSLKNLVAGLFRMGSPSQSPATSSDNSVSGGTACSPSALAEVQIQMPAVQTTAQIPTRDPTRCTSPTQRRSVLKRS